MVFDVIGAPRPRSALLLTALLGAGCLLLQACSGYTTYPITGTVGITNGVALTIPGSVTQLPEGTSLLIRASVPVGGNNQGVSWSVSGPGSLANTTGTQATFIAPTGVTGQTTSLITATSIANPAYDGSVVLVTLGSPQLAAETLYPANLNTAYSAVLPVAGGLSPYSWSVSSGALPTGLSLTPISSSAEELAGTPTAGGTFSFTLQVGDAASRTSSQSYTLQVNPQVPCLLQGNYVFELSGFRGGAAFMQAGRISISASGAISGEMDFKSGSRTVTASALDASTSVCTARHGNSGHLALYTANTGFQYNFATTAPDSSGVIHAARLALVGANSYGGAGELLLQDPTAITGNAPSGNFAFGLLGVDAKQVHFGTAGQFTTDASGNITSGAIDSNDPGAALSDAALSGTLSTPDADGRGTASFSVGGTTSSYAYYIVNASRLYLLDIDSASGTPRAIGSVTAQTGTFDNTALASPSILSLWGNLGTIEPSAVVSLGRLSNANSTAGTIDAVLDTSQQSSDSYGNSYSAQSYSVSATGRGTLTLAGAPSRSLVFYLDGPGSGYVVEAGSPSGSAGLLEAQTAQNTSGTGAPYADTVPDYLIVDTQFPQTFGPTTLNPMVFLNQGTFSSPYLTGRIYLDPTSGRGLGEVFESGVPRNGAALYVVGPNKLELLSFGSRSTDGTIDWLVQ